MSGKYHTQHDDKKVNVQVSSEACRDGRVRTDYLIRDKSVGKGHSHVSVDTDGNLAVHKVQDGGQCKEKK
ncbi:MAG: hypothetical protein FWF71_01610 [Actinomycetia bacterium]|nr:hypothetical protein [Actinomycetes bacterium]